VRALARFIECHVTQFWPIASTDFEMRYNNKLCWTIGLSFSCLFSCSGPRGAPVRWNTVSNCFYATAQNNSDWPPFIGRHNKYFFYCFMSNETITSLHDTRPRNNDNWHSCEVSYHKTSIKCRVPNKRWVSNKRRGFEANVLINAGSRLNAGSQINARVF